MAEHFPKCRKITLAVGFRQSGSHLGRAMPSTSRLGPLN
jgi:hypothetical protein